MQDLTLVGLSEDKSTLLLVSDSGEEYTLPADARLRAALRGDHARLGQLEIQMDSALRPRDIQARIRAGETPEDVAQAAQTTVDRIMAYAAPVLAERAHIAQRAQRASLRRKNGEGPARVLEDAVADTLRSRNVDPETVEWDSWRREDGRWTLVAAFRDGERTRHAEFVFDAPGRYVVAEDDDARRLVGEQTARRGATGREGQAAAARRLAAVGEEELPLGTDAIELVTGSAPGEPDLGPEQLPLEETEDLSPHERTIDLTRAAQEVRRRPGPVAGAPAGAPTGDADWIATQASERPAGTETQGAQDQGAQDQGAQDQGAQDQGAQDQGVQDQGAQDQGAEAAAAGARDQGQGTGPESATAEAPEGSRADGDTNSDTDGDPNGDEARPSEAAPRKSGRKGRRASVPSWDEIMFGGGRPE